MDMPIQAPGGKAALILAALRNALTAGDYDRFGAVARLLDEHRPEPGDDRAALAEAHLLTGSHRQAQAALRDVLRAGPLDARVAVLAAKVRYELGDLDCRSALRVAVCCDPAMAEAWALMARDALVQEDFADALALYRRTLGVRPTDYDAMVGAAAGALGGGFLMEALRLCGEAIETDAARPEAYCVLGTLHLRNGAPLRALGAYVHASNNAKGRHILPVAPLEGVMDGPRGVCNATYALVHGKPRDDTGSLRASRAAAGAPSPFDYAVGTLSALPSIPADGRFHPRDRRGAVRSLRLSEREVERLHPPANLRPLPHRERFFKSSMFNWYRAAYEKFAWQRDFPFPDFYGTDGCFLTSVDKAYCVEGFVFTDYGEYIDESTLFDELVLAAGPTVYEFEGEEARLRVKADAAPIHIGMPCAFLGGYHLNPRITQYAVWLFDIVPKLRGFAMCDETRDLPLAIPERAWGVPYVRETLAALGIPESRLIRFAGGSFAFDRLYLAQSATRIHTPSHLAWVRAELYRSFGIVPHPRPFRRFYLSRDDAGTRRMLNEPALMHALEARGFERLESSSLSMAERVRLFSEAECVVGVNGAGMANILFCPPSAKIVEICPKTFVEPLYWMVANHLHLSYGIAIEDQVVNHRDDFLASVERIRDLLDEAGVS